MIVGHSLASVWMAQLFEFDPPAEVKDGRRVDAGANVSRHKVALVLRHLADFAAQDTRTAWPGVRRLADTTRMSVRSVEYALRVLTDLGVVERRRRRDGAGQWLTSLTVVRIKPAAFARAQARSATYRVTCAMRRNCRRTTRRVLRGKDDQRSVLSRAHNDVERSTPNRPTRGGATTPFQLIEAMRERARRRDE